MMAHLRAAALIVAIQAVTAAAMAQPDSPWDRVDIRGIIDSELAVGASGGEVQKLETVITPEATVDLGAVGRLTGIARFRFDPADELEPGRPDGQDGVRSAVSRRGFLGELGDVELRELYLDSFVGEAFLRLGKQQIVWGEADGLRVLDVVNPFHFREFILPEFEDRRIPLWTAMVEVPVGPLTGQLVWLPDHSYDDVPGGDSTFAFSTPRAVPRPPAALVGGGPVRLNATDRPDRFLLDDDVGLRFTGFLGGWDFSLNYLYHYRDEQVLFREPLAGGGVAYSARYERSHLVGGSFSNAFGDFTLRGELGYSTDRFFLTNDAGDADGVYETNEFGYVLGLDYQVDSDLRLSGQIFQSVIERPPEGATRERLDTNVTLLIEQELRNDTITASALVIQSADDGDGLVDIDLSYQLRSNIVLTAGADVFYGDEDGLFGQFQDQSRITVGIEIGF